MSVQPSEDPRAETRAQIALTGTLRAQIAGREVAADLPGRQGRALFAYLVVNRQRPVGRAELIGVLWPGELPDAPEAGLSTVLARVRRALGDGVVTGRADLHFGLRAEVDTEHAVAAAGTAERALAAGEPREAMRAAQSALDVIGRPLLAGIEGEWVESLRSELEALEPGLLEVLGRAALVVGDREHLATAERVARTLAERHPFRESGHALLIEIHGRRGNVAEATLAYDRLRVFLRDELGTVPSNAVSALHEELLTHGRLAATPPPPATTLPPAAAGAPVLPLPAIGGALAGTTFVGREEPLERLRTAWQQVSTAQRRLALLGGEAGVGKTRLAAQFAAEVHGAGATVLYGRCEQEPLRSYQPFIEALRHELRHGGLADDPASAGDLEELARILPEAARADSAAPTDAPPAAPDPETERYRLFEAITRLVARATERAPLLLVLDDLHWIDRPTLLLLRHLLRHPDPARLLVLGMARRVELHAEHPAMELISDLAREQRFDRIPLVGLTEPEADALVAARLGAAPSAAFVRGLREQTEGNPFFMEESLRALVEAEVVERGAQAQASALQSIGVPESVAEVILRRLARVSELAREALTIGATTGREFDLSVVQALLDDPGEAVIEALEEAIAAGLVAEVADAVDRFAFSHALARDAIYGRLSRTRRLRLHLRVATSLEAAGASAVELARHFFAAREIGAAAKAVRYSVLAGDEAARSFAYEDAVEQYRRALEAIASDPAADEAGRCDILLALGRVQWRAGDGDARATYVEAATIARERSAAEPLARAALGLAERYWEGDAADRQFAPLIAEAVRMLPAEDSTLRARLMGRMAENQHFSAEAGYGIPLSAEALAMARRLGDPETLVMTLMSRHVTLLHIDHLDERVQLAEEVLALSGEHGALRAEALHWRLFDIFELGLPEQARRDHAELTALGVELRQPLLEHLAVGWEAVFALLSGDVEAAERFAGECFELGRRAQVGHASSYLSGMLFTLRRQQGRVHELLPTMDALIVGRSASRAWIAALALAQVETGAVAAGREHYERLVADNVRAVPRDWYWTCTVVLLAESCCVLGDRERARQLYDLLEPFAERYIQVIFAANWGSVQRPLGMLAAVLERYDAAERHFRAALEANGRIGAVLMTAETQCDYGAMLLARDAPGDRERALTLAGLVERFAEPRGLEGLRRRAGAILDGGAR
jgi:DNA-binding SARP family transcriptional activator